MGIQYLKKTYVLEDFEPIVNPDIIPVRVEPILDEGPEIKLGIFLEEEKTE